MCTAISMKTKDHYFGRTLDIDRTYGEEVCILPRNYSLSFRKKDPIKRHYAIIGMAAFMDNIPLFYDAANEHGLAMAGLNFPGNAYYDEIKEDKDNITPFELIPWILGKCQTVSQAKELLERINIVNIPFSKDVPLAPLHWMISDKRQSIVAEAQKDGVHIYDNPVGVMTNNPPFKYQLENLEKCSNLRIDNNEVDCKKNAEESFYSQGLGAVGLPGDVSSMSRFVRAAFGLKNSVCNGDEESSVGQFFHLLSSVEMVKGTCKTDEGTLDITVYSSCINTQKGLYYYTTYDNRQIVCVDMHSENLDGNAVSSFSVRNKQNILYEN